MIFFSPVVNHPFFATDAKRTPRRTGTRGAGTIPEKLPIPPAVESEFRILGAGVAGARARSEAPQCRSEPV